MLFVPASMYKSNFIRKRPGERNDDEVKTK